MAEPEADPPPAADPDAPPEGDADPNAEVVPEVKPLIQWQVCAGVAFVLNWNLHCLQGPPPLPEFPINWSSVGIRIETLLPVDPETLVNSLNEVGRPAYSMAIVDVKVLVERYGHFSSSRLWADPSILSDRQLVQELAIDPPSELGEKLIAGQVAAQVLLLKERCIAW